MIVLQMIAKRYVKNIKINLLCSSEGAILAGSSISADACESKAYNFN